jgi:hypothetical protein
MVVSFDVRLMVSGASGLYPRDECGLTVLWWTRHRSTMIWASWREWWNQEFRQPTGYFRKRGNIEGCALRSRAPPINMILSVHSPVRQGKLNRQYVTKQIDLAEGMRAMARRWSKTPRRAKAHEAGAAGFHSRAERIEAGRVLRERVPRKSHVDGRHRPAGTIRSVC